MTPTDHPTPAELAAFDRGDLPPAAIDRVTTHLEACPDCEAALEALAGRRDTAGEAVSRAAAAPPADGAAGSLVGGRYRLVEPVGEGGMGAVWRAEQTEPVRRPVAVKLVKPGMDSAAVLRRFEAERQALALMDHPNIARVYDAGTTDRGRPFFAMELVAGPPITDYCDAHRLTPRERLALFVPVCQAVQHAHQKGVIHRDIKPSNVLVAEADGRPVPKVIDFGIAKATAPGPAGETAATAAGMVVGTPEYMAPEQASPDAADVDTRADVFALGVLLYELLTGSTPLTRRRLKQAALLEVLRLVREEEPPTPSSRLSTADGLPSLAADRNTEPRRLAGLVRGELDWVVMKCLEKDRGRRYESAGGLARDVERFLADEPVEAGRPTRGYRLRRFARRHRRPLLAAAALGLTLAAAAGVSTSQAVRATRAEAAARDAEAAARAGEGEQKKARETAEAVTAFMQKVFAQASAAGQASPTRRVNRELTVREAMDYAAAAVGDQFQGRPGVEAAVRDTIALAYFELGDFARSEDQYRAVLAVQLASVGADDPATLATLDNLGHVFNVRGRYAEAEEWLNRALAGRRRVLGDRHLDTSESLGNLAAVYFAQGRHGAAVPLYEEALAVRRAGYGDAHARTLTTLYNLANTLDAAGQPDRAEPLLREVLATRRRDAGDDHPLTHLALLGLGANLRKLGRPAEAEPLLAESAAGFRRVSGDAHPRTALAMTLLAHLHLDAGRTDRAEPLLRESLAVTRAAYPGPAGHPDIRRRALDLGLLLAQTGRPAEAEPLLREAGTGEAVANHRAMGRVGLGLALAGRDPAAAEVEVVGGLDATRATPAGLTVWDRRTLGRAANWLARRCQATGRPADAALWRAERAKYPPELAPDPRPAD